MAVCVYVEGGGDCDLLLEGELLGSLPGLCGGGLLGGVDQLQRLTHLARLVCNRQRVF